MRSDLSRTSWGTVLAERALGCARDVWQETPIVLPAETPYTRTMAGATSAAYHPEDLLVLLRKVLPPGEAGSVPIPVRGWGDDLKRQGVTRGGGVALRKRLRKLARAGVIDLHPVRGHLTFVSWHIPERRVRHRRRDATVAPRRSPEGGTGATRALPDLDHSRYLQPHAAVDGERGRSQARCVLRDRCGYCSQTVANGVHKGGSRRGKVHGRSVPEQSGGPGRPMSRAQTLGRMKGPLEP